MLNTGSQKGMDAASWVPIPPPVASMEPPKALITAQIAQPTNTPPIPPKKPIPAASPRKMVRMLLLVAPTAFMIPISRVRSRIAMVMVLAMPMAATSRAIAPTPPKTNCMVEK